MRHNHTIPIYAVFFHRRGRQKNDLILILVADEISVLL